MREYISSVGERHHSARNHRRVVLEVSRTHRESTTTVESKQIVAERARSWAMSLPGQGSCDHKRARKK